MEGERRQSSDKTKLNLFQNKEVKAIGGKVPSLCQHEKQQSMHIFKKKKEVQIYLA